MNLRELSDPALLERTEVCAQDERRATVKLIEHLREINRRKLYSALECDSLHRYYTKKLKLSDASAHR